jgi:hypothetical protein
LTGAQLSFRVPLPTHSHSLSLLSNTGLQGKPSFQQLQGKDSRNQYTRKAADLVFFILEVTEDASRCPWGLVLSPQLIEAAQA